MNYYDFVCPLEKVRVLMDSATLNDVKEIPKITLRRDICLSRDEKGNPVILLSKPCDESYEDTLLCFLKENDRDFMVC
jgi:hypothetical protein